MPRTLPATRMADLADAARQVFMQKGYRRTQVADIAREAGISPAALYRHVESKEALFHLCFLEQAPGSDEYLATPAVGETLDLIHARVEQVLPARRLRAALRARTDDPAGELAAIVTDVYVALQDNWQILALIEASAQDLPELDEAWYRVDRRQRTAELARYVRRRVADGSFRSIGDPEIVALQIRESCAWFAWHRRHDADAPDLDDGAALAAVVDLYVNALVPR